MTQLVDQTQQWRGQPDQHTLRLNRLCALWLSLPFGGYPGEIPQEDFEKFQIILIHRPLQELKYRIQHKNMFLKYSNTSCTD